MRLLEAEARAASITGADSGAMGNTQASNFSRLRRSAALTVTGTASMPNCRKQSTSRVRLASLRLTRAVLAPAFFKGRTTEGDAEALGTWIERCMMVNHSV